MYDKNNIKQITLYDAIRLRPGMYIGSLDDRGKRAMLWEFFNNTLGKHAHGFSNMNIQIDQNQTYTISIDKALLDIGNLDFTAFSNMPVSMGIAIIVCLSEHAYIRNAQQGYSFHRGKLIDKYEIENIGGFSIQFSLDDTILKGKEISTSFWKKICTLNAHLHPDRTFAIREGGTEVVIRSKGLIDLLRDLYPFATVDPTYIYQESQKDDPIKYKLLIAKLHLNDILEERLIQTSKFIAYCNDQFLPLGGTPNDGLKKGWLKFLRYLDKKNKDSFISYYYRYGDDHAGTLLLQFDSDNVSYSALKDKVTNPELKDIFANIVFNLLKENEDKMIKLLQIHW